MLNVQRKSGLHTHRSIKILISEVVRISVDGGIWKPAGLVQNTLRQCAGNRAVHASISTSAEQDEGGGG